MHPHACYKLKIKPFQLKRYICMSSESNKKATGFVGAQFLALWTRFRELILYGLIGGFCTALDFGLYTLLGLWIPYLWANILSVHAGIFCSFFLNRSLNFKVKDKAAQRFTIFYLVGLSGLALSEGLIWLLATRFGWDYVLAKLLTVFVVALYQFVLNKFITFKKTKNG